MGGGAFCWRSNSGIRAVILSNRPSEKHGIFNFVRHRYFQKAYSTLNGVHNFDFRGHGPIGCQNQ